MSNNKIKIIHFVSSISKGSGVMSVIMNYYRHIDTDRFQFDFIYFKEFENNYSEEIILLGGNVYYVTNPKKLLLFKKQVNEIILQNDYKIMHNHEVYLSVILKKIILPKKIKLITHSHNTELSDMKLSKIRNRVLCTSLDKNTDLAIACSEEAGNFLFKDLEFEVLYNSVDLTKFYFSNEKRVELRKKLEINNDKIVIGNVGRLNNQKNQIFILEIFSELIKIQEKLELIIIGEGPLRETLEKRIYQLGIKDKVMLLPFQENINDYLQIFDLFILPSLYEGLPVVGVEAQAVGLTCIFSDSITKELSINSNSTHFLSLEKSNDEWISYLDNILKNEDYKRDYFSNKNLKKKGFDIKESSKKLADIYIGLQVSQ